MGSVTMSYWIRWNADLAMCIGVMITAILVSACLPASSKILLV